MYYRLRRVVQDSNVGLNQNLKGESKLFTKRVTSAIVLVLVLVFASTVLAKPVQIWNWRGETEFWAAVEREIQKEHPHIKIEYRSFIPTEYDSILMVAMQGGEGPDIITLRGGPGVIKFAEPGMVERLDDKLDFSLFPEGALTQASMDGEVYGVPFALQTYQIYYNREIYEKYGLQEPATWDELISNCQVLQNNGVTPLYFQGREGWGLSLVQTAIGASILGAEWITGLINGENAFTDPEFIDSLYKVLELKPFMQKNFEAASYTDMQMAFPMEAAAMTFAGMWDVKSFDELAPDKEWGMFLVPPIKATDKPYAYAYMDGAYGLNSESKVRDDALKVLEFTTTQKFGQMFVEFNQEISPIAGISAPPELKELQQGLYFVENDALPDIYGVRSVLTFGMPDIHTMLGAGMQAILSGEKTPEQLGQELQEGIASWYEPFQK